MQPFMMAFVVSGCAWAEAPDDAVRKDQQRIAGNWIVVSAEFCGEPVPNEVATKMMVIGTRDRITLKPALYKDQKGFQLDEKGYALKYRLDPSTEPKRVVIEMPEEEATKADVPMLGIYHIEGDTLRICWHFDGKTRPEAFKTKPRNGMLFVLKRVKE